MNIKKQDVIDYFGSCQKAADFFSRPDDTVSRQAVFKWPEYIPELRAYQLKERRPDIYDSIVNS